MLHDKAQAALGAAKRIKTDLESTLLPPSEVAPSSDQPVILFALFNKCKRGYIQKVVHQVNRTYSNACYDACSVMIRRLVETLIIEAFEHLKIASKIQDTNNDFKPLRELIDIALAEPSWNLTRNAKSGLKNLKLIGDLSAHSRRYNAHREDIDKAINDLRVVAQEFLTLAGMN